MSYGFMMYFKQLESKAEALNFAIQIMDDIRKHARDYIMKKLKIRKGKESKEAEENA